jgi:hypothetical protein
MLWTTLNHLGGSWKSVHEDANFAASLFYDRISRVSKWSFPLIAINSKSVHSLGEQNAKLVSPLMGPQREFCSR